MKSASTALINLLNNSQTFVYADLYTLTLSSGSVLTYTTLDKDVTYGGVTYSASDLIFERDSIKLVVGIQVDTLNVRVFAPLNGVISNQPFFQAAVNGKLDGAQLRLDRGFLQDGAVIGTLNMFLGQVAQVKTGRTECQIEVKSFTQLLDIMMPRNLYQSGCQHTLYDSGCTLAKSSFSVSGTVFSSSSILVTSTVYYTDNKYDLGFILINTGANAGEKRTIKSQVGNQIYLLNPLPQACAAGDTFTIYAGCDKTQATCTSKFNNVVNFKGQPYIPSPETML